MGKQPGMWRRRLMVIATAALLACGGVAVATGPASAVVNAVGSCLDANSVHYSNDGDNIQLWGCNNHSEQLWHETKTLTNFQNSSGLCLDANSNDYPNDGDNLQLWDCNTHPEQVWSMTSAGQLEVSGSGMCLDANSNDYPKQGDAVQLWACNTHPEQLWSVTSAGQLRNSSGLCLDANSNDYPNDGDNVQLWACNTNLEQRWTLTGAGQLESFGTGPGPAGPWGATAGPVAADEYYGYPYPDAPQCTSGSDICVDDRWGFDQGQCTSWVAYRLNELNGITFQSAKDGKRVWGSAIDWRTDAEQQGYTVNHMPALGSVAWYSIGHVAYVEQVLSPTSIVISEMNYDYKNGFRLITVTTTSGYWPTDFLHIADR